MKTCTKCNIPKSLDEFVKDKRRTDGRGSWCVLCICHRIRSQTRMSKEAA